MKKKDILKAVGVLFLIYVVLSWIIPGGSFTEATLTTDTTTPLGIADIIMYPIATFFNTNFIGVNFAWFGIIVLLIGGLYGVMNKTSVYPKIVDGVVKKFTKKKRLFLVISVLIFALISALTTLPWPLLVLVPFFITVICLLGYDKITAFMATVGAILVGNMTSIFGYQNESVNYFYVLFGNDTLDLIVMKIALFVICVAVLLTFVLIKKPVKRRAKREVKATNKKGNKKEEVKEEKKESYLLYEPGTSKKKAWPMVALVLFLVIINLIGMYNWVGAFNFKVFNNIYQAIVDFKINNHAIFANILGTNNSMFKFELGTWGTYNLAILLLVNILIIARGYGLSWKDAWEGFKNGAKQMLPTALVVVVVNVIYLVIIATFSKGTPLLFSTIASGVLGKAKSFDLLRLSGVTIIGSTMFNELQYVTMVLQQPISSLYAGNTDLVQVVMTSVFGFMMLILPTSTVLVAGLGFADLTWKDYLKGGFKILLGLLIAVVVVTLLFMYCPGIKVL